MGDAVSRQRQPAEFRKDPQVWGWEWIPELGTIIVRGDAAGVVESLGRGIHGVRKVFLSYPAGSTKDVRRAIRQQIATIFEARLGDAPEHNAVAPMHVTAIGDGQCTMLQYYADLGIQVVQKAWPRMKRFPIFMEMGWWLEVVLRDGVPEMSIVRRTRHLKRRARNLMRKFGLRAKRQQRIDAKRKGKGTPGPKPTRDDSIIMKEVGQVMKDFRDRIREALQTRLLSNLKRRFRVGPHPQRRQTEPSAYASFVRAKREQRNRRATKAGAGRYSASARAAIIERLRSANTSA